MFPRLPARATYVFEDAYFVSFLHEVAITVTNSAHSGTIVEQYFRIFAYFIEVGDRLDNRVI